MDNNQNLINNPQVIIPPQDNKLVLQGNILTKLISRLKSKLLLFTILITTILYIIFILTASFTSNFVTSLLYSKEELQSVELGGIAIAIFSILIVVCIYAIINGIFLFILLRKIRFLFIGFFVFLLVFAAHYAYIGITGDIYLKNQAARVSKNIDTAIGKEPVKFTYLESTPSYDTDNVLANLDVVFEVVTPMNGDYEFNGYLATPYDIYGPEVQQVPRADSTADKIKVTLNKDVSVKIVFHFPMEPFVLKEYSGDLKLNFDIRRVNLAIKGPDWDKEPITSLPVKIKDSGKSKNFIISNARGVEEPVYTIGPFQVIKPGVTITPSEKIPQFNPPLNWNKFETQELSFFYPREWKEESLTPTKDTPTSVQFYLPNSQREETLTFTVATYSALEAINGIKKMDNKFIAKSIMVDNKLGTRITYKDEMPYTTTDFIFFKNDKGSIKFMGNKGETLSQILGTIKFTK